MNGASPDGARRQIIPAFRCPSDPGTGSPSLTLPDGTRERGTATSTSYAPGNYVGNVGDATRLSTNPVGVFGQNRTSRFRDILDGTSQTIAVSECIIGSYRISTNDGGNRSVCTTGSKDTSSTRQAGYSWFYAYYPQSCFFNTYVGPNNSKSFDCGVNSDRANAAARSLHVGGVQATLCDGSVKFISENIDLATWRNLGNKDDGNVVGEF